MADVRSLLRNERASRRITHPHASYTESGKLLCNICALQIKSESQWETHVKSPPHNMRLQHSRSSDTSARNKKRKAGDDDEDTRKRLRNVDHLPAIPTSHSLPHHFTEHPEPPEHAEHAEHAAPAQAQDATHGPEVGDERRENPVAAPVVDEDEWAAFQRDMAADSHPPRAAISAAAVISAAPMTAEEIAAQARQEQSLQRSKRDAEIEAEKDEAEQALQDEFDEMEELEDRVKRLRERREALQKAREAGRESLPDAVENPPLPGRNEKDDQDEDEDEDDYDYDDWNFGAD